MRKFKIFSGFLGCLKYLTVLLALCLVFASCDVDNGGTTTYTVTFNANGGTPAPDPQNIASGSKVAEPEPMTKAGVGFGGWYTEAEFINQWNFATGTVTGDITLYAQWYSMQATDGLLFTRIGNAYSVSKGTATAAEVVIPPIYEGLPVTEIASSGFYGYTNMTSITIPNSVTSIGYGVFNNTGIWNNTPDNSVVYADKWAVGQKGTIVNLVLELKTVGIGEGAFSSSGLTSVTIPNNVTSIGEYAFSGCSDLTSITVSSGNTIYKSDGNCVIRISDNTLIIGIKTSVIPDYVTSIGDDAFRGCMTGALTIPNSVTSIGEGAFYGCSGLTSVTIPNSVKSIGDFAFNECSGLTSVTIPNSVTSISYGVFNKCTGLTSVTFQGTISSFNFSSDTSFPGNLRNKYFAAGGGVGAYTRNVGSDTWSKQ